MSLMNVVRFYPPGGPEKLRPQREPIPQRLESGQMLIRVCATSVIATELYWPIYQRKDGTYIPRIPCHDFSGTVVRMGSGSEGSELQVGSEVYAFTTWFDDRSRTTEGLLADDALTEGALAEYAIADLQDATLKPKNLSLLECASIPLSALTAWQALHDHGQLKKGQRLLITGAGGATGLWAVQIARMMGAYVIGTASSPRSIDILKELKINEIIDYKKQSLEEGLSDIDLVLDTVGGQVLQQCTDVVKKDGMVLSIVDNNVEEHVQNVNSRFFIVTMKKEQLEQITKLIEDGKLRTFVDSVLPLDKAVDAFKKGAESHAHGKILVKMAE